LLAARAYRLFSGWVGQYRFAVDRAKPGKLKALAVNAFSAAIGRLPSRWSPNVSPEWVTVQI
jgi:hypothetical protein